MTYMGFEMNGSHSSLWFWENSGDLPKFTEMLSKLLAVVESRRDILTDQGDPVFVICHWKSPRRGGPFGLVFFLYMNKK